METRSLKWLILILCLTINLSTAQKQTIAKPTQIYSVQNDITIKLKASHQEIEIERWNQNKVEIEGILEVEGLPEHESKPLVDKWEINVQSTKDKLVINSGGPGYNFIFKAYPGDELDFLIPNFSEELSATLEAIPYMIPDMDDFPDFDFDFDFGSDTIVFDMDKFKNDENYMKEWQEKNKVKLKKLEESLKRNEDFMKRQEEMQKRIEEANKRRVEANEKRMEATEKRMKMEMAKRDKEIQKIIEKRTKQYKSYKVLKIRIPKNAKLEMDVDHCKVTSI